MIKVDPGSFDILRLPSVAFEDRHTLPRKPGVYFALNKNDSVLYIGRCYSLYGRWHTKSHHLVPLFLTLDGIRIAYIAFDCADIWQIRPRLLAFEYAFICHYRPLYNKTKHSTFSHWQRKYTRHESFSS